MRWLLSPAVRGVRVACAVLLLGGSLRAQCGAPTSTCRQCHKTEGRAPVGAADPWHADHAFGDFCVDCHGGAPSARTEPEAHATLLDPLANEGASCRACHADAASRVRRYAERRSLAAPPGEARPPRGPPPAGAESAKKRLRNDALLAVVMAFVALGGLRVARADRRRGRVRTVLPTPRAATWSPYASGALLGIVVTIAMAGFGHRLSGSAAYVQIAAPVGRALSPASIYWNRVIGEGARWELAALAGAVVGAFVAARLSGTFRIRTMPDAGWTGAFGPSVAKRWLVAFAGAALTELAAGIAGGCTASLAVSGGAVLAPGAFVFMMGMFGGGIPTAWFVYRRSPGRA